jgi:hypothetical protein
MSLSIQTNLGEIFMGRQVTLYDFRCVQIQIGDEVVFVDQNDFREAVVHDITERGIVVLTKDSQMLTLDPLKIVVVES